VLDPAWVALSLTEHIGGKTLRALMTHFGDSRAILNASLADLRQVPGIGPKIARSIQAIDLSQTEAALRRWNSQGVRALTIHDEDYPARLREVPDAPPTLFVRGGWPPKFERSIAVVGTRSPATASMGVARQIGAKLTEKGFNVVSGLALGIDTQAHMSVVLAGDGYALAVLGSGVLNIYPPTNQQLAKRILDCGALVCEVAPEASPSAANLVARNRIISGLCEAVIVVETSIDGGAMYAAKRAQEQGRRVYALDNQASGNRALIDSGAMGLREDLTPFDI
jgi:DNA processing protein